MSGKRDRTNELKVFLSDNEQYVLDEKVKTSHMRNKSANFGQMGRLIRTEGALVSVSSVRSTAPWVPSAGTIRHAC